MRYYLTQDHFHYDDSGYYGYVLFSGTNAELHGLLNALGRGDKEHGFGWHRWGRSFRPADNGTVYDYYIRLRSKTGTKPAPGVVEAFLKEALPPRETLTGESERELAQDDAPNSSAAHRSILNNGTKNPKSWNSCSKTKSGVTKI